MKKLDQSSAPKSKTFALINATLLDADQMIEDGGLIVSSDLIQEVGGSQDILKKSGDRFEVIDASGYVITPGLINAHTHCCLSYVKNLCHGDPDVIRNVFFATEKHLTPDLVEGLSLPYVLAGLRSGVTTFSDHFYYIQGTARALETFGVRGILFECINDRTGPLRDKITWNDARSMIESWPFSSLIQPGVGPHATDTLSPTLFKEMATYAKQNKLPLHFHLGQTDVEMEFTQNQWGKTPVQVALEAGALFENALAVHLLAHTDEDMRTIKDSGATVGFCPSSQLVYERLARIDTFYENKIPIALGTDCSLHDSGDLMRETRLAALLARDRGIKFNSVNDQFDWVFPQVTTQAAKVLRQTQLGRIAGGYKADLVFLLPGFHNQPINQLKAEYIYGFDSGNVEHVMIDGRWALWKKSPCLASERDIQSRFDHSFKEIQSLIAS